MVLTPEQVRHIAKLARILLREDEVEKFSTQLTHIFQYMSVLDEVDTKDVLPTSQVTGLQNVTRPDEVKSWVSREELLGCTELPVEQNQIRVKPVFGE
ncbi:MAG: Asp-tRNA(Asn)/Glu-tRNA(Gln) amidotransferase subunit GatC [Patescibacteria group bacterium]